MIIYKLLNHSHEWDGDCFLSDIPSEGFMPTIKKNSFAKKFYKNKEKEIEEVLSYWNIEFEKVGDSEEMPKPKVKPIKRKKGK